MRKTNNTFYIKCGNFFIRIVLKDIADFPTKQDAHIEAATRAISYIFGNKEWEDDTDDELLAVYDTEGHNVLENDEDTSIDATYTLLTDIFIIKKDGSHKLVTTFHTSGLFVNAGLYDEYNQAIAIEQELDDEDNEE